MRISSVCCDFVMRVSFVFACDCVLVLRVAILLCVSVLYLLVTREFVRQLSVIFLQVSVQIQAGHTMLDRLLLFCILSCITIY